MNPPTVGHKEVFDTLKAQGGDYRIFLSKTQDSKKNPLDYATKVDFVKRIHPQHADKIVEDISIKTPLDAAAHLYDQGYNHITFVGGDDRKNMYDLIKQYNGVEGKQYGYYKFDSIDFESAGAREDDADGVAGISATLARKAATNGDIEAFAKATGAGEHAEDLYKAVRQGLNMKESVTREGTADTKAMMKKIVDAFKPISKSEKIVKAFSYKPYRNTQSVPVIITKDPKVDEETDYPFAVYIKSDDSSEMLHFEYYDNLDDAVSDAKYEIKDSVDRPSDDNYIPGQQRLPMGEVTGSQDPVAKNLNKFNKPQTHKDRKKAMKRGDVKHKGKEMRSTELFRENENSKRLAELGRILMDKAVEQKDDTLSQTMSVVGSELTGYGEPSGANSMEQLEKRTGMPKKIILQLMQYASKFKDKTRERVPDPEPDTVEEDSDSRETLELILQKIEREIEWPLTDIMDPKQVRQLLRPLVRAVNEKMQSMVRTPEGLEAVDEGDIEHGSSEAVNAPGETAGRFGSNVLSKLENIVDNTQAMTVSFQDGKGKVDMFTASAIMQVYNAVNDDNKSKMKDALSTKPGFMKIAKFAMQQVK